MFTVAIDGPAAAGKGTISRALAEHFGFACLDTGLLYRAVARKLIDLRVSGGDPDPAHIARGICGADLERDGLRDPEVTSLASVVAAIPAVRQAMLDFQRQFATRPGGAVLDGRDIGSVICPDADIKFHVTADEMTRARRRHLELSQRGLDMDLDIVRDELRERDERDRNRGLAALTVCDDAILIDTTELTICQAVDQAIAAVRTRMESA